jgi:hypothetical protein
MKTKGIFVAACVLAFTIAAPAGLQFMVDDKVVHNGDWVFAFGNNTFSIVNDKQETGVFDGGFIALYGHDISFGNSSISPGMMPGAWSIQDIGLTDLGFGPAPTLFISWDAPAIDPFKAGKLASFDIRGKLYLGQFLRFFNYNAEPVLSIQFTPEPATLALLGLGAMMIRRKHSA